MTKQASAKGTHSVLWRFTESATDWGKEERVPEAEVNFASK